MLYPPLTLVQVSSMLIFFLFLEVPHCVTLQASDGNMSSRLSSERLINPASEPPLPKTDSHLDWTDLRSLLPPRPVLNVLISRKLKEHTLASLVNNNGSSYSLEHLRHECVEGACTSRGLWRIYAMHFVASEKKKKNCLQIPVSKLLHTTFFFYPIYDNFLHFQGRLVSVS